MPKADIETLALPPLPMTPPVLASGTGGFLRWLTALVGQRDQPTTTTRRPTGISDGRGFNLSVVGESHHQMALRRLSNGRRERGDEVVFRAWLAPDANNPYDPNAVAVLLDDGKRIGHLPREWAAEYRKPLNELCREGYAPWCRAKLIGGNGHKKHFGVLLDVRDVLDGLVVPF